MSKPGSRNQSRSWNNSTYERQGHRRGSPPCTLASVAGRQPYFAAGHAAIEADTAAALDGAPCIRVTYEGNRKVYMATYNGRIVVSGDFEAVQSQVVVWQAEHDLFLVSQRAAAGI